MKRTWKSLGFQGLMAAVMTAAPAFAGPESTVDAKKLDAIQEQLGKLKDSLAEVKLALAPVDAVDKELRDFRREYNLNAQTSKSRLDDLSAQITQLRSDLDTLRNRMTGPSRTSAFGPSEGAPAPATGRLELINTYMTDMAVIVNGRSYRLRPFERVLTDPIPVGNFTYEVLNVTEPRVRPLAPNQVFSIHIHPQP